MYTVAKLAVVGALILQSLATPLPAPQRHGGGDLWDGQPSGTQTETTTTLVPDLSQPTPTPTPSPSGQTVTGGTTTQQTNTGALGTVIVINQCNFAVGMHVTSGQYGENYDERTLAANSGSYNPATYGAHFNDPMQIINNGQSLKFWPESEGDMPNQQSGNELQLEYTIYGSPVPATGPLALVNYDISEIDGPAKKISYGLCSPEGPGTPYTTPTNGIPVTMDIGKSAQFYLCGANVQCNN